MGNDKYEEHPLDSWLDAESEEEFGEPEIRNRFDPGADENVDGNLKNWTAQDFASIYVRFRPHLERHARRYLTNPVQAEEVVQDAFLYLMTSLLSWTANWVY
jgi:RNA polymerase sigma-70 factor (ECF subfamily)